VPPFFRRRNDTRRKRFISPEHGATPSPTLRTAKADTVSSIRTTPALEFVGREAAGSGVVRLDAHLVALLTVSIMSLAERGSADARESMTLPQKKINPSFLMLDGPTSRIPVAV